MCGGDERQSVTDEDDAQTLFDVVEQAVDGRLDRVGQNDLTDVEAGAPRHRLLHQYSHVQRPRTRQHRSHYQLHTIAQRQ